MGDLTVGESGPDNFVTGVGRSSDPDALEIRRSVDLKSDTDAKDEDVRSNSSQGYRFYLVFSEDLPASTRSKLIRKQLSKACDA